MYLSKRIVELLQEVDAIETTFQSKESTSERISRLLLEIDAIERRLQQEDRLKEEQPE